MVDVEDGLKFACIDFFIATTKKKEGALHTDRPVFEFPNHTASQTTHLYGSRVEHLPV